MFCEQLANGKHFQLAVHDVIECIHKRKKVKRLDLMESTEAVTYHVWWPQVICRSVLLKICSGKPVICLELLCRLYTTELQNSLNL